MAIRVKRVYEPPAESDGTRVLVDRIWPRGLTKKAASLDEWVKELAPSTELRKWFNHDPARSDEFKQRYFKELAAQPDSVARLAEQARDGQVTLVFAAREDQHNNAVALKEYLEQIERP